MDAVQFGRWLSERRRQCGFSGQRALVESVSHDPALHDLGINEDFLARLETGRFVHPFRGIVRKRVFALAWFLCRTPREVKTYLRAAELSELDADEAAQVNLLHKRLEARHTQRKLPLPPRALRFVGREATVHELVNVLRSMHMGVYAITGMPGVGKSALAAEVVHRLTANERECLRLFPDGIAAFTCTGRRGIRGLVTLLEDIAAVFSSPAITPTDSRTKRETSPCIVLLGDAEHELARAIDRVRLALADQRILLLLDGVEAELPLRQALEALLPQNLYNSVSGAAEKTRQEYGVVLVTSRCVPPPALITRHLHLEPLEPEAALECLTCLIGHSLRFEEMEVAQQICALVGYLPLALEVVATAVTVKGIPLPLLAAHLHQHPLDDVLDGEYELRSRLTQALTSFDTEMRKYFALLSTLGGPSFRLTSAAAIHMPHEHLARTAADLGQFVRHSLIDLAPPAEPEASTDERLTFRNGNVLYRMHPLLHAYAQNALNQLAQEDIEAAKGNLQTYALTYLERYRGEIPLLERERDLLFAALTQAHSAGPDSRIVSLVEGLAPIASRLRDPEDGKRLFRWGIQASQHVHDRYHQARFLNGLGWVHFERGEYGVANQLWTESLDVAAAVQEPAPMDIWASLADLADIAYTFGEYDTALRYSEMYLKRYQESSEAIRTADAHYCYAVLARLNGNVDAAYKSAYAGMSIMTRHDPTQLAPLENFIGLRVQIELARVQGDYAASQATIEQAAALIQERGHIVLLADLLFDQALFAGQQSMLPDGRDLARRVMQMAEQARLPHFRQRGMHLWQQFSDATNFPCPDANSEHTFSPPRPAHFPRVAQ